MAEHLDLLGMGHRDPRQLLHTPVKCLNALAPQGVGPLRACPVVRARFALVGILETDPTLKHMAIRLINDEVCLLMSDHILSEQRTWG